MSEFCRFLSNASRITGDNNNIYYQPCCWVNVRSNALSNTNFTSERDQVNKTIINNKKQECNQCLTREKIPFAESMRLKSFRQISKPISNEIRHLQIQIDNTCNAACVMCNEHFSSLWEKQNNPRAALKDFSKAYNILYQTHDFKNLEVVSFMGGEPFLSSHNVDLLKLIPSPGDVKLQYSTNGSITPSNELIAQWSKFKSIHVSFSVDGTNNQFEYIRWPLQWQKVFNNIQHILGLSKVLPLSIGFNYTANPLNICYYSELENWYHSLNQEKIRHYNITACYGAWGLDATPEAIRQFIQKKHGDQHPLTKALLAHPIVPGKFEQLLELIDRLDQRRHLNSREVFSRAFLLL